jgi:hypothetical protein
VIRLACEHGDQLNPIMVPAPLAVRRYQRG